jgi:hypothetical protein
MVMAIQLLGTLANHGGNGIRSIHVAKGDLQRQLHRLLHHWAGSPASVPDADATSRFNFPAR